MTDTPTDREIIAAAAIEWAVARAEHWALVQATYRDTGLPSKPAYAALMAAGVRMADHTTRLEAMALEAATSDGRVVAAVGQMSLSMEAL